MDQKTEAEIIARVLNGDRQVYSLLVEEYKAPVYNLAYRMTGNSEDADDLAQETFIRAYCKIRYFNPEKKFFTWLYTIGINLIRNHLKKNMRNIPHKISNYDQAKARGEGCDRAEDDPAVEAKIGRMEESLRKLPVDLQEAVILRFYQDIAFEEIATITGASVSAVKMRVYRGLAKLKQRMGDI
jgi:RNA polymerase sigma-70 factor (ECF subfamily)